ncbi:unnamed protein product [Camellia sinensis]
MSPRGLHELFSKFGVVRDVFIPQKRRRVLNTRFGFVRFDCQIAASMAAQKANGLWIEDRKLSVKNADYGKEKGDSNWMKSPGRKNFEGKAVADNHTKQSWNQGIDNRSFAEAVKGINSGGKQNTTVIVEEIGNGWLYESLILRLKSRHSVLAIKEALQQKDMSGVLLREGGGRDVVMTFKSKEDLRNNRTKIIAWFQDWCVFIKEWSPDLHVEQERIVWLSCYGIPLNLWNSGTFRKIGRLWGEVVSLDEDICEPASFRCGKIKVATSLMELINSNLTLECNGRTYPIRVCEEQIVKEVRAICKCNSVCDDKEYVSSNVNGEVHPIVEPRIEEDEAELAEVGADEVGLTNELVEGVLPTKGKEGDEMVAERSWLLASIVEETTDYMGKSNVVAKSRCTADIGKATEKGAWEVESMMIGKEGLKLGCNDESLNVGGQSHTPGSVRSVSEALRDRPGINLEVLLGQEQCINKTIGPGVINQLNSGSSQSNVWAEHGPIWMGSKTSECNPAGVSICKTVNNKMKSTNNNGKRKVGVTNSISMGGFSGFARRLGHGGAGSSKVSHKGVVVRAAAAAMLKHAPDKSQHSCSGGKLHEAQLTLILGKRLGVDCLGQDEAVIQKLVQMEEVDKERIGDEVEGAN